MLGEEHTHEEGSVVGPRIEEPGNFRQVAASIKELIRATIEVVTDASVMALTITFSPAIDIGPSDDQ